MNKKSILTMVGIFLICAVIVSQGDIVAKVFIKNDNIYFQSEKDEIIQLTDLGRDTEYVLHPNGKWVYFVRTFVGEYIKGVWFPLKGKEPADGVLKMELWRIDVTGQNEKMLFRNSTAPISHPSGYAYASIDNIQISPNGNKIYFETAEWVTSNALNEMNLDGSSIKMLGMGNETKIILSTMDSTDYSGYIVTNQHRYYVFGPSYDIWWLYDSEWNEIGPLGPDLKSFTGSWDIEYTDGSEEKMFNE